MIRYDPRVISVASQIQQKLIRENRVPTRIEMIVLNQAQEMQKSFNEMNPVMRSTPFPQQPSNKKPPALFPLLPPQKSKKLPPTYW
jgi:hypothetical protein